MFLVPHTTVLTLDLVSVLSLSLILHMTKSLIIQLLFFNTIPQSITACKKQTRQSCIFSEHSAARFTALFSNVPVFSIFRDLLTAMMNSAS